MMVFFFSNLALNFETRKILGFWMSSFGLCSALGRVPPKMSGFPPRFRVPNYITNSKANPELQKNHAQIPPAVLHWGHNFFRPSWTALLIYTVLIETLYLSLFLGFQIFVCGPNANNSNTQFHEKNFQKDLNNNSPRTGYRLHSKSKAIAQQTPVQWCQTIAQA